MSMDGFQASRRSFLGVLAAGMAVAAAPVYAKAPGLLRGAGDVRKIAMYNQRTGESLNTVYYANGRYIPEAMTEISFFMRDWRHNVVRQYHPGNIDILATTLRMLETDEPYLMISGYRTPQTNRMLRGAAKESYHMRAMAADVRLRSRDVSQVSRAALACRAGGVGIYNRSNFVHMDCGPVRTWRG
ncbi:MAG TPA: DUF882 domain-containing protein [Paracoccaceae bacterium]|nr:DUF882 domain-containing protein [Paracoccaceae bacterium]